MDLFVDSGVIIHLFDVHDDSKDRFTHIFIKERFDALSETYSPVTTNFILIEACNLICQRIQKHLFRYQYERLFEFLDQNIMTTFSIIKQDLNQHIDRSKSIISQYSNFGYSFVDALSLALIEHLGGMKTFTTDEEWRHFVLIKGHQYVRIDVEDIFSLRPMPTK